MSKEIIVMIIGALPVLELRWAIPQALFWKMPLFKAFWLAVAGNIIPVVPALFLLEPISNNLRKFKLFERFFDWFFEHTKKKANLLQKYEALGLVLFVAVPIPGTGAWTGALAASLFKIKFRYAFPAIVAGILIAGIIVLSFCSMGIFTIQAIGK
ncbi:MAG: small multi-drug export protein [Candidatus Omnitrophota bacterium]|nr:small multi-drug export protein [Candidatus Omnitrophota bacterium]